MTRVHKPAYRVSLPVFVLLIIALVLPVSAQEPAIITVIDPNNPPLAILSPEEVDRITTLQSTYDLFALSTISPDDTTMIIGRGIGEDVASRQAHWLNIQTGEMTPIANADFLTLTPQSQAGWQDDQTVIYLAYTAFGQPMLVTLDRITDELTQTALELEGRPLSLAPNGSRLLFEAGTEHGLDLMVLNVATGDTETLMSYPNGSSPQSITWTADGSKLAVMRHVIPPDLAADPARLNALIMQDVLGQLPLAENPTFASNVVDVYDFAGGVHQPAALQPDPDEGYLFHQVVWSADGSRLLTRMVRPAQPAGRAHPIVLGGLFPDRAYYRVYDAELKLVAELDRPEIEAPTASRGFFLSADEVIISATYRLNVQLYYFNLQTGAFRELPTGTGTFVDDQVVATHQANTLIYLQSSFQSPPELYRLHLAEDAPERLTDVNATAAAANQIRVDELSLELADGTTRSGYLLQPAGAAFPPENAPMVLYQQGGPGGAMTNRWGATAEEPFNLLPNFGVAVLFMPFAGREGFGADFYRALADEDHFGEVDIAEGAQAVQYLVEHHYTRSDQIGITGCSYGGYYASQSLTQYPDLYAAANVQCAVLDLVAWAQQNPFLLIFMEGATLEDQMAEYQLDSPAFHAAEIKTPVLLFHGTDDQLPISIVEDFTTAIAQGATPVQMITFQDEGHTLVQPMSKLYAAQYQIDWFRTYLQP